MTELTIADALDKWRQCEHTGDQAGADHWWAIAADLAIRGHQPLKPAGMKPEG